MVCLRKRPEQKWERRLGSLHSNKARVPALHCYGTVGVYLGIIVEVWRSTEYGTHKIMAGVLVSEWVKFQWAIRMFAAGETWALKRKRSMQEPGFYTFLVVP